VTISPAPDDLLIQRAKRGDSVATDTLLRMHYDSVRTVCHRIVVNKADAEDATQHALISIVRALPGFDGRAKFSTWVYRIATNAALDEVRRIRRRPTPTDIDATFVLPVADGTGAVEAQMDVAQALALLPEEYRTTLVLRHVTDLDYEEIAEIQGVPVGTVRSRLARGRTQLANILGNQDTSTGRHNPDERNT
jgi:RNA polymerase sigma-70 factor (ECF subfamily)